MQLWEVFFSVEWSKYCVLVLLYLFSSSDCYSSPPILQLNYQYLYASLVQIFYESFFQFYLVFFHIHRVYTVLLPMLYTYLILTTIWSFLVDIYLQHFAFFYFCQQICLYGGQQFNNFDVEFLEFYILYVWLIFKQFM